MTLSVVILAAGQGKRMHSALPKVLQPLAGRPLLAHVLETALSLSPATVHCVVGHGADAVRAVFADAPVEWVLQSEQLGTGHAVQQVMPALDDAARVLVLFGDVPLVRPETFASLLEAGAEGIGILTAELANPDGYGRILRDVSGRVTGVVESRDADTGQRSIREINTGILVAPAVKLRTWLSALRNDNSQGEYYLTDIVALAVAEGMPVNTVTLTDGDEAAGVNDKAQLATLERAYQRRQTDTLLRAGVTLMDPARFDLRGSITCGQDVSIDVNCVFEGDVELGDRVTVGPNCVIRDSIIAPGTRIEADCVIEHARIGRDCRVGPFARIRPETELADGARVGNFVETKNTKLGEGAKVNHLSYVGDAEIGADANIGAGTITCNYDGVAKHRTVIGAGAFVGSNSSLVAPVEIGAGATIGAGSVITKDAPADRLTMARADQSTIEGWKRPSKKP